MAAQAKPAPDTDQRNLDLLKDSNGNWLRSVTIGVAAEFLQVSPQRIRTLVFKGRLASEGFRQTRRILVSSLSVFEPDTHEKRSARAKVTIGKVSQAERLARGKKAGRTRMERFTPEQRSAFPKAWMDKSTHEERSTLAAARFAKSTPEHLSAFRGTADERHARAKKANATLTSEQLSARAKKGVPAREAKKTPEQRFRLKEERAKLTFEEQSAIATKAANTRKAKYTPEQRSAWGKKAAAAVSPEKQIENGNRLRKYHADLKAKAARLEAIENGAARTVTMDKKVIPAGEPQKHNLSLLTKADGTLMEKVTSPIAVQFLGLTERQVQKLMKNGTIASEGFRLRRRIRVDSLLAYAGIPS